LFVAEISANHLGSLDRAKRLIKAAAKAGASAVKFQTYTAQTMTLNLEEFRVSANHKLWGNQKLFDLYHSAHTPWEWHPELFEICKQNNVIPFSTPFDPTAVDFLESLGTPMYKISSMETGDIPLIRHVAETGKPLIISTGATEWQEIKDLVSVVKKTGNKNLTLLVCTSSYPALPIDAHLKRISTLKEYFGVDVGISDHTLGIGVSIAAIALGATVIEKHITLSRADGGADSAFSTEPEEFATLVKEGISAYQALGNPEWLIVDSEQESRRLRRSLYVVKNVKAGELVTSINIRSIRPSGGCSPKYYDGLIGRKFKSDQLKGTPMSEDLVE
jgi:pseudaminic acid synthase